MGHDFEGSLPGHTIMNMHRPEGHGHLDQKHDKGMRSPYLPQLPTDAGLESPSVAPGLSSNEGAV